MAGEHPGAGHRGRLRDKFLAHGLGKFTDEEVLELLLTLATPRRDCKQQARALMKQFGSLAAVLEAEPPELGRVKGVGPVNILGLKLVPAVARRYLEDQLLSGRRYSPAEAADYLAMTMRPLGREVFMAMFLDIEHRCLAVEEMAQGTVDQTVVYPREVAGRALAVGASAVACAHNHPSGDPSPSQYDLDNTRALYLACRAVGVELLDHLIVAQRGMHSLAQGGLLRALAAEAGEIGL